MRPVTLLAVLSVLISSQACEAVTLKVGLIDHDRPPYFWLPTSDNPPRGAYIDILEYIGQRLDIEFEYQFLPQARIRHYMKNQRLDLEPGIDSGWRTEPGEREASVYTLPLFRSEEVIVYNRSRFSPQPEIDTFVGARPCKVLGFNNFELSNDRLEIERELLTEAQLFEMLLKGRCDYALFPTDVFSFARIDERLAATLPVASYDLRIRLSRQYAYLVPDFNRVINELRGSNQIRVIFEKYQRNKSSAEN
ncbi:transporter substrate-binding domain-containing protein [Photobacterium sp. SDRW27]|uniref:substrate-binding periplasmic protein n=1 Tax=Photobacterium obscurum TaxID=2829490 RepID=UPI002243A585|nr:transporter substrate-binding domain-containing protein [Photobacterium obscurum]MCW8331870.1 transporter substrate-binding domain-containing protein [Photobacterium obscurum]